MAVLLAPNASFIPAPLHIADPGLSAFRWGMSELNDRVIDYGYGGIELHWSNAFPHCRELAHADPVTAQRMARGIVSAHEGWVGTADPQPADPNATPMRVNAGDGLIVRIGSALFPHGTESLNHLEALECKLDLPEGKEWHYVLFPDQNGRVRADQAKTRRFPVSSIQPTVDVAASWGARTVDDFVEELKRRGYRATIDDFHISRDGKIVEGQPNWDWRTLVERLLQEELVEEVHVSVARHDFATIDPDRYATSQAEARALVDNGNLTNTPLGEIADMLCRFRWAGNVAIEATTAGLGKTFGKLSPKIVGELHRNMAAGVKRLLPHAYWLAPIASGRVTYVG